MKQSNLTKIFKALSSEQRLKLFLMIYNNQKKRINVVGRHKHHTGSRCCGVMKAFTMACDCLSVSRSTVSHHLKELQSAGLVKCTREGQSFYCEVNEDAIDAVRKFLQ